MTDQRDLDSVPCFICGSCLGFEAGPGQSLREALCRDCRASLRNSDVARVLARHLCEDSVDSLARALDGAPGLRIYETQAGGPIHGVLKGYDGYVCSEFSRTNPVFPFEETRVRSENLEALSFGDNSFDVVISQDVFEHLHDPEAGFLEVRRVLKPGGVHIFTVPLHQGRLTRRRVEDAGGTERFLLPPVYHGDALRRRSSLVYTDFGDDLPERLEALGLPTRVALERRFYQNDEIPLVEDRESYEAYMEFEDSDRILEFFLYNSLVLVSTKRQDLPGLLEADGERYLPWLQDPKIHYEHLHRYGFAAGLAAGRKVLDLASGEGYGSHLVSAAAASVCGVDIDRNAVAHARSRYPKENLRFVQGSMLDPPLDPGETFDMIVCFEALEHVDDHARLMAGVRRHLRPGGLFLVSTPDKEVYSDEAGFSNPYHVRELYFEEFQDLLLANFRHLAVFGQKLVTGSRLFPIGPEPAARSDLFIERQGGQQGFRFVEKEALRPEYYVAVASDEPLAPGIRATLSDLVDVSSALYADKQDVEARFNEQILRSGEACQGLTQQVEHQRLALEAQEKRLAELSEEASRSRWELERLRQSKAWRLAEFFREIVYRRLFRNRG
jgi:2-polyprenyl-3-methyl-5-hydroxy-6-metoxy-1,4-benzoquinol methylase